MSFWVRLMARKRRSDKKLNKKIYIFCEGKTEKNYFDMLARKYRKSTQISITAKEVSKTAIDLINYANNSINQLSKQKKEEIGQIFIIFDKDQITETSIKKSFEKARKLNYNIGFSNASFELWVLLHFVDVNRHLNQKDLERRLEKELKLDNYSRSKGSIDMISKLEDNVYLAMKNGSKFDDDYAEKCDNNPYTNLKYVIEEIFKLDRY